MVEWRAHAEHGYSVMPTSEHDNGPDTAARADRQRPPLGWGGIAETRHVTRALDASQVRAQL